jgi:predicted RNA binding protein YcfA (HicA-like mRNA interferase family)
MIKKVREMIAEAEADGWRQVRQEGSHRQYHHPTKTGTVTIPGHPGDDLDHRMVASIRTQMKGQQHG